MIPAAKNVQKFTSTLATQLPWYTHYKQDFAFDQSFYIVFINALYTYFGHMLGFMFVEK